MFEEIICFLRKKEREDLLFYFKLEDVGGMYLFYYSRKLKYGRR